MMFSSRILPFLVQHTKPSSETRVLDMFANLGIVSVLMAAIFGSESFVNDNQIFYQPTILGTAVRKLYNAYLSKGETKDSPSVEEILKNFEKKQFCSDMPLYPIDPYHVNPYDAWILTGFHKIVPTRVNLTNIDVFSIDQSSFFPDSLDIILLDPPFGRTSSYLASETKGRSLAKKGLDLARTHTEKGTYLLIRKPEKWSLSMQGFNEIADLKKRGKADIMTSLWQRT